MASTPKQVNGNSTSSNGSPGKRKKSRGIKGSYISKWLDKSMHHIQASTPSCDTYDSFISPAMNWPIGSQFGPGYDYRHMYDPMLLPTHVPHNHLFPFGPEHRYNHVNKSVQVQRPRVRRRCDIPEESQSTPSNQNYLQPKNFSDSQDYASLPPIVTSAVDANSNCDMNTNDKDDSNRRFSDPCVQGLPDIAQPANGDMDCESDSSSGLSGSQVGSRLLTCLLDQIASLKSANDRLTKELMDTKMELENTRQHNAILQKGSNSSLGATPNHSLNDNGDWLLGAQYSPGFLTDLVREIRDAARIREEAMYNRVRALVLERTDNGLATAEAKYTEKTLEEIKSTLRASEADKRRMMDRILKLEDELRLLRVTNGNESNDNKISNGNVEDAETERQRLRKEIAELRKGKQLAEEQAHKLERTVTQLRSKFNGLQINANGPESLPSDPEHDTTARARRNSNNSTVVFGPVTDL